MRTGGWWITSSAVGVRFACGHRDSSPQDAARELPNLPREDALQLVHLYAERGSPKYEKAAMRWLERYLTEGSPKLKHFAELASDLAKREPRDH